MSLSGKNSCLVFLEALKLMSLCLSPFFPAKLDVYTSLSSCFNKTKQQKIFVFF